nr:glycosyltransferase [Brachybacterium sp. Marseille-Q7125]
MAAKALTFLLRRVVSGTTILVGVNDTVLLPYRRAARTSLVVRNSAPDWFASHETGARKEHPRVRFFHGKATGTGGTLPVLEALTKVDEQVEVLTFPSAGGVDGTPYLPDLQKQIDRLGVREQLVLSESVPHTGMPVLMDSCDVGMIGYGRELGRASLPNRLFEYMARGLPVLAPGYSPLIKAILEEHKAGITCDFEDPDSIAEAMSWFATHPEEARQMGRRARAAFDKHYSWAAEFAALAGAMRSTEAH